MTFLSYTDWPNLCLASIEAEKTFIGLGPGLVFSGFSSAVPLLGLQLSSLARPATVHSLWLELISKKDGLI